MALAELRSSPRGLIIEAIVIVASILAAFSLDRWWDARQDRAEEQLILQALHDDFSEAKAELERRLEFHQRIEHSVRTTLEALRDAHTRRAPTVTVPDTALSWAWITPTTQLALGTLNGLLASGRLGLLRDRELRIALSTIEHVLSELTEEEAVALVHVRDQLDPALRRRIDISPFVDNTLIVALLEMRFDVPGMDRQTRVPVDTDVIGVFAFRLAILQHGLDEFPPVFETVDTILRLIERSMN